MRIELVARAALTLLVVVCVGAAGCSEDEPEKGPVITTTAPSATAPPKPKPPAKPDDGFENVTASGYIDTQSHFELTGYVRNTGNANGVFKVFGRGEDAGIAVFSDTEAKLDVPALDNGLATRFKITVDGRDHKSVRWTYWAVIDGGAPGKYYGISFAF